VKEKKSKQKKGQTLQALKWYPKIVRHSR